MHDLFFPGKATTPSMVTPAARPEATSTPTAAFPAGSPWLRANANTSIHISPEENSAVVALLETGEMMPVVGISADGLWLAIKVPYFDVEAGWVRSADVLSQNVDGLPVISGGSTASIEQRPTDEWPVAEALTSVNIRSGPGTIYPRIGLLEIGQVMPVVAISPDEQWLAIQSPIGEVGWVARNLVAARNMSGVPVGTPAPPIAGKGGAATPAPGAPYLKAIWTVNVRAGPGQEYAVIGKLEQNQAAELVGISADGNWWAIRYSSGENERGWVAAAFAEVVNAEKVPVLK